MTILPLTETIPVDFEGMDYEHGQAEMRRLKRMIEMALSQAQTKKKKAELNKLLRRLELAMALPPV